MTYRRLIGGVAACALLALAATTAHAFPGFYVARHVGGTTASLANGAKIMNTVADPTTIAIGGGTLTCSAATLTATVTTNGNGFVPLPITTASFSSCTDTLPSVNLSGCHNTTTTSKITLSTAPAWHGFSVRCAVTGAPSFACYYGTTGSVAGVMGNDATGLFLRYSGAVSHLVPTGATDDLGASACGTSGTFATALTRWQDLGSGATVTVLTL